MCELASIKGLYAQTLENSVRQFAITFLGLIGSNPQFEGAFRRLLPVPVLAGPHRDRSEFFCHKTFGGRENRYAAKQLERASSEGPMLWHFCSFDICRAAAK